MTDIREQGIQLLMGEKLPSTDYIFPPDIRIYPILQRSGFLIQELHSKRMDTDGKYKGLTIFQARNSATLYFDGHYSTISAGDLFSGFVTTAHKIKLK